MRESWTDERLDDFRDEVNRRFDKVDADGNYVRVARTFLSPIGSSFLADN